MKLPIAALFVLTVLSFGAFAQPSAGTATATEAKTADKPKKPAVFRPTKDQILEVQNILKTKKLYAGEATGKYNDETRTGIKSFQKDNGLKETGTLNRATLEKFGVTLTDSQKLIPVSANSFASADTKSTTAKTESREPNTAVKTVTAAPSGDKPKKPAPFRANEEQVKAAQKILIDGKMYGGEQTGKLDDSTRDGLKKYQEANKIKVTGTLNAITLEKMGIALTDAQKANVAAQTAYEAANKN
jgi:peptidoglycan hydrolase-like protein with peptidoglycan-binding domain